VTVFYIIDLANPDKKQAPGIKHFTGASYHIPSCQIGQKNWFRIRWCKANSL